MTRKRIVTPESIFHKKKDSATKEASARPNDPSPQSGEGESDPKQKASGDPTQSALQGKTNG